MSAATDKARFYLEQSVPELKEYERKKIFNKVSHIPWRRAKIIAVLADRETTRMKSLPSSRKDQISNTSSMRVAHSQWILYDMFSMR